MTTYKIKNMSCYVNTADEKDSFFGFKNKILQGDLIKFFIGKVSRVNFVNSITNKDLNGIPLTKLEEEMILFFTSYFAGELNCKFEEMKKLTTFNI